MIDGGISTGQWVALVAASLMLMLVWRNMRALDLPKRQMVGMALIWAAVFFVLTLVTAQFVG